MKLNELNDASLSFPFNRLVITRKLESFNRLRANQTQVVLWLLEPSVDVYFLELMKRDQAVPQSSCKRHLWAAVRAVRIVLDKFLEVKLMNIRAKLAQLVNHF